MAANTAGKKKTTKKAAAAERAAEWAAAERTLEWVDPATLAQDPQNARRHTARNRRAILASAKRHGPGRSVVIQQRSDGSRVIRAGNGTVEQFVAARQPRLAAVIVHTDDDAGAAAYAIADNRSAELAEWNDDELVRQLSAMDELDRDLLGFDADEFRDLLGDEDDSGDGGADGEKPTRERDSVFRVLITEQDGEPLTEDQQLALLDRLGADGFTVQALIT